MWRPKIEDIHRFQVQLKAKVNWSLLTSISQKLGEYYHETREKYDPPFKTISRTRKTWLFLLRNTSYLIYCRFSL